MTARLVQIVEPSTDELGAIESIAELAFWQLMLVDDLERGRGLVEFLVRKLRAQIDEIIDSSAGFAFDKHGELVEVSR